MKRIPYIIIAFFALLVTSCRTVNNDMDTLCVLAEEVLADTTISEQDKITSFAMQVADKPISNKTKSFFRVLAAKGASPTYSDFTDFASENGIADWECGALEAMFWENPTE